ncbi:MULTISPECIES: mechanosensitive ion channel family protein [unclassified Psychrobacter]|uniref:mechanosensitive ion channel family protein n=1 Tax=unclassified Psychrobacter TaxID=196806 RepID=UPI003FD45D27
MLLAPLSYAASTDKAAAPNASTSQAEDTPDGFVEYAAQQIDTLQEDGIDFPDSVNELVESSDQKALQQVGQMQGDVALSGEYNANYYVLDELNSGLPALSTPANLATPLSTLEFFQSAIMKQQYDLAAQALNLNLFDENTQASRGVELSRQLDFLLSKKQLYVFDDLPDRPDGLVEPPLGNSSSINGIPRRSILLGYMDYRERQVPIFIQRVRVKDNAPVWVFSAQTVDNITNLYDQYQPAEFERYLPPVMTLRMLGIAIWEFLALAFFFILTLSLGWLLSKITGKLINWYVDDDQETPQTGGEKSLTDMISKLTVPLTFTISFSLVFTLVSGGFPYVEAIATATRPLVWVGLVLSAVWLGIRVIHFFANRYRDLQIDGLADDEYNTYRVRMTYLSIFRRVFIFVMILGSFWIGLSEFTNIEGLGKTLLTSAGIAGVVLGVAAQPTLGNIIAGMQVAITQPVRIGDTVMMEGDWTNIEDLRYTYAVLKTWDERRLIVPMRHFVTQIVENWSHTEFHQTCVVYLYVDYGVDVEAIRQKFIELVKDHDLWDQETEPAMLVVSVDEDTIKLRGALASDSPLNAWTLECDVREQMLTYLNEEQKEYLPAERITFK